MYYSMSFTMDFPFYYMHIFCIYTGGKGNIGIVANIMGWQNESMVSDIIVHSQCKHENCKFH